MKFSFTFSIFKLTTSAFLYLQKNTVRVPDSAAAGGKEGNPINAVDPVIHSGGNLSRVVFKLRPYILNILTGGVNTPAGAVHGIEAEPQENTNPYSKVKNFPAGFNFTFAGLGSKEFQSQKNLCL